MFFLFGADIQENHTQQNKYQVECLCLKILLMKERRTEKETDHNATTAYH